MSTRTVPASSTTASPTTASLPTAAPAGNGLRSGGTAQPRRAADQPQIEFTRPSSTGRRWIWVAVALGVVSMGTVYWIRPGLFATTASDNTKNESKNNAANGKGDAAPDLSHMRRVSCLGRIEPRSRVIKLAAPTSPEGNRVQTLMVEETDRVAKGQTLAVLDTYERREAVVVEKESGVRVAEAKLAQVKAGAKPGDIAAFTAMVIRSDSSLQQAENEYERVISLRQKNPKSVSDSEVDKRRAERDTAKQTLEHARAQLVAVKEVRDVDVQLAEAEIARANAELKKAKAELTSAQLVAPIDGTILKVHARSGERVGDRGVVEMADVDHMYVVAEVYEADVQRLTEGQRARIHLPSWKEEIEGEVDQVGNQIGRKITLDNDPVADTDARVIEVRIRLSEADSKRVRRMTNMRVEVSIETGDSGETAKAG